MFPDSTIAKSFQLGADKIRYIADYGIAPYFKGLLIGSFKKGDCFVVSFDESLNDVLQSCEMGLLLRYFNSKDFTVKVLYYDSRFFGHVTHQELVKQFNDGMKQLDVNKLLQISMDGRSVNHKFPEEVSKEKKADKQHQLVNIGSCGLHNIHGININIRQILSRYYADMNIKQILKGAFQVFHDSPAMRDDFESVTGTEVYHSSFVPSGRYSL